MKKIDLSFTLLSRKQQLEIIASEHRYVFTQLKKKFILDECDKRERKVKFIIE